MMKSELKAGYSTGSPSHDPNVQNVCKTKIRSTLLASQPQKREF